jgi:hypothetical protein
MRGGVWKNCGSWHPVGLVESLIQRRLRSYSLTLSGLENLELMRGGPCIIAANHVQPENRVLEASGFGPDSFVIQDVVRRMGWRLRIVAKYELDEWQANTIPRFLHPWAECLQRKLILMHGDIPVRRNSVRNKTFLRMITRAISNKDAILWYPTGVWAQDFSLDQEVRPGVAYVAKRFGVPQRMHQLEGLSEGRRCVWRGDPLSRAVPAGGQGARATRNTRVPAAVGAQRALATSGRITHPGDDH